MKKFKLFVAIFFVITMFFMFVSINSVKAVLVDGINWVYDNYDGYDRTFNFIKGKEQTLKLLDDVEGLTIELTDEEGYNELPEGLTLNPNGTITGTVSENAIEKSYYIGIKVTDEETNTINKYFTINVLNSCEGADFDNIFMDETTVKEPGYSKEYYTKAGFLVYSATLSDYVSYNALTRTYNVTLTQDILGGRTGNYVEIVFKASELNKYIKYEILENVGFINKNPSLIEIVNYPYTYNGDYLYSAYMWVEINPNYTGSNRHLNVKISNPSNPEQYRYISFNIVDTNEIYVAFESDGGNTIPTLSTNIGETITLPTEPTKEGWNFKGWYVDEACTVAFNPSEELTRSIVLYAKWENDYKFIEGAAQTYTLNKSSNAKFKVNANYELLDKVLIDDTEIDSSKYVVEKGSTIITLKDEYIKSLDIGEHTLKATYTDGYSAQTTFVVANKTLEKDESPKTGDNTIVYASILAVITLGGIAIVSIKKK